MQEVEGRPIIQLYVPLVLLVQEDQVNLLEVLNLLNVVVMGHQLLLVDLYRKVLHLINLIVG